MGLGRQWGHGYCGEYTDVANALNKARRSEVGRLEEFVKRLETGDESLMDVQADTIMREHRVSDYDRAAIEANWYGDGGPSMWKPTARQRPVEIKAVIRRGRLELAKRLLKASSCEIWGQCGHDDCEIRITWPSGPTAGNTVKMWVFVPDNSAYGPGTFCRGAKLDPDDQAELRALRAEVAAVGTEAVALPASGAPYATGAADPVVGRIQSLAAKLPSGFPIYRELGLTRPDTKAAPKGEVKVSKPAPGREPALDQQGADSRDEPDGPEATVVRIGWKRD